MLQASMARHPSGMTVCYWLNRACQLRALLILVASYKKPSAIPVLQPTIGTLNSGGAGAGKGHPQGDAPTISDGTCIVGAPCGCPGWIDTLEKAFYFLHQAILFYMNANAFE